MMTLWKDVLGDEKQKPYFKQIMAYVDERRKAGVTVYPPAPDVFNAFKITPFDQIKVVILGQDPYHGPNQAHGLCFSVLGQVKQPPSLVNIFKELESDINGFQMPSHGNLSAWAAQGVLLLNTVLTVEQGRAHSHANIGWETFTDKVIAQINQHKDGVIFMLWGSHAQKKGGQIDKGRHRVLSTVHPSPLSAYRGFFGCKHFSQANQILESQGLKPINWQV
jgi:uracil-DNA glycosylase